jgi:hypothetical protein
MPNTIGTRRALLAAKAAGFNPAVVSSSFSYNALTGGTSISITAPSSIASGNLLIAASSSGTETFTPPTGWLLYGTEASSGDSPQISIFTKIATGSEPGSYSFTCNNGASDAVNIAILNISGANTASPVNGMFSKYQASATTAAMTIGTSGTSIPTVLNCLPLAFGSIQQENPSNSGNPASLTSGWTGQVLAIQQDISNFSNLANNNGYNAMYIASGPLTTSTASAVTAGWTWQGSSSNFTGTAVMLFIV